MQDKHINAPNAGQTKKCTRMTKTEVHKKEDNKNRSAHKRGQMQSVP